eukprot:TRINITY_DN12933_c0_g1_i1.p1 TRINITY_DN12933_c0_g1~~TRINITY_DN12933_c0_g1_i1.p1  ORF type:complete len:337 (-),score=68.31 TRINITY_DN12933_c0_g1_i1:31-1041(-)
MDIQQDNQEDINLGYKTLVFLGQLEEEKLPLEQRQKLRELVANICDFQNRFAKPMELPLAFVDPNITTTKFDMPLRLETPRPLENLLNFRSVYPCEPLKLEVDPEDVLEHEGKYYCFAGKPTWSFLVKTGALSGPDAESPDTDTWDWFKILFDLFAETKQTQSLEIQNIARRLASCWYQVATQIDFGSEDSELTSTMSDIHLTSDPGRSSDEEDEEDEGEEGDQDDDDENENEDSESSSDVDVSNPIGSYSSSVIKSTILQSIDRLQAYMPSPESDMVWFKRMLKSMNGSVDPSWFPWGIPPLNKLVESVKSQDLFVREYAYSILKLFSEADTNIS